MKNLQTFLLLILISFSSYSQEYNLNYKKTIVYWTGKAAFNAYSLTGTIKAKKGKIVLENDSIKQLEIIIDMKTLDHKNKDLKKHLRGKDFFEVRKHKTARFFLTKPVQIKNNKAILIGQLSIKNVTKTEKIEIEIDNKNGFKVNFNATLDRTEFGVKFNSPSIFKKMKENAIADNFLLKGELIFN